MVGDAVFHNTLCKVLKKYFIDSNCHTVYNIKNIYNVRSSS